MSLPEFNNEAEFRTEWIAPFLAKLGYILPKHVHGTGEQGKDFFFAEYDKFGHLKFSAAQVKLGNIGAGQVELNNLLDQVRRSFTVTLKYHKGADRQRISSVYLMTNGSISDSAREYISDYCRQEHYGENVFYLDGATLDNLDRHATFIDDKSLRNRLLALRNELKYNESQFNSTIEGMLQRDSVHDSSRVLALEDALRNPLPEEIIPYDALSLYWRAIDRLKNVLCKLDHKNNEEAIKEIGIMRGLSDQVLIYLGDSISEAIQQIDSRYSLELEIEED